MAGPIHPVCEAFGVRLRALRSAQDLTQEKLAHRAELDRSYVGQVERGERNIALINQQRLAQALGISLAELMDFDTP